MNQRPITDPDLQDRFDFRLSSGSGGRGKVSYQEMGESDVLLINDGHGHFTPASWTDGRFRDEQGVPLSHPPRDWGLSAQFVDLNGDGAPELYVCNDFASPDRLWINDGHGHFQLASRLALRQTSFTSMGVDAADVDQDGFPDLMIVDMLAIDRVRRLTQLNPLTLEAPSAFGMEDRPQYPKNTLQRNRGDGTFAEVACYAGLEAAEWAWAPVFLDVDLDGLEDLLVTSGFELDNENVDVTNQIESLRQSQRLTHQESLRLRARYPRLATGNLAFRNLGQLRFRESTDAWGLRCTAITQGIALADLDNDGDLDLVINSMNGPAQLYRNNTPAPRFAVRLKGKGGNTRGIGSKLSVQGGGVTQTRELKAGGRYLSGDDAEVSFAAFNPEARPSLEVRWRNGKICRVPDIVPGHLYEVEEPPAVEKSERENSPQKSTPWFEDQSHLLSHRHVDAPYDDLQQQPLMDRQISYTGPGVAWRDVNRDGWDDLIIGGGKGGSPALYLNDGKGGFTVGPSPSGSSPLQQDQTAVLGWAATTTNSSILIGQSAYEEAQAKPYPLFTYSQWNQGAWGNLQTGPSRDRLATGPMTLGFAGTTSDPFLFVGGRVIPGRYPQACASMLFHWTGEDWAAEEAGNQTLLKVGPVSGAVMSDLTGDGIPELLLACDGGPIRTYQLQNNRWTDQTAAWQMSRYVGFWNGITTGDFDGDGRLDIAASNWGENSPYHCTEQNPLRIHSVDVDGDGTLDLVLAMKDPRSQKWMPWHPFFMIGALFPALQDRFSTHQAYAEATLDQVFDPRLLATGGLQEITWLSSTIFLNRGDHFEPHSLPTEAQLSPAFGISVADFDGDGHEDLMLSQNFFRTAPEVARFDAGRGLLLRGDGRGGFSPVPGQISGILVYGEQRGSAVRDFDGDGRTDWVVGQNSGETKLFHNRNSKPGLRVRLSGPVGNQEGIGATLRAETTQGLGPAREIHAGSGHLSQDSNVQILNSTSSIVSVTVRWPGGKTTTTPVSPQAREVTIDTQGRLVEGRGL